MEIAPPGARYGDADIHEEVVKSAEDVFDSALALAKSEGIDVDAMLDMNDAALCDNIRFAILPERRIKRICEVPDSGDEIGKLKPKLDEVDSTVETVTAIPSLSMPHSIVWINNEQNLSHGLPASGYEYLAGLEYYTTGTEDNLSSDGEEFSGASATVPSIGFDFEDEVVQMQALAQELSENKNAGSMTRIELVAIVHVEEPQNSMVITDFLVGDELEVYQLKIYPKILGLVSASTNDALCFALFEDNVSKNSDGGTNYNKTWNLPKTESLEEWAKDFAASIFEPDPVPQLPNLVFDHEPLDDFSHHEDQKELVQTPWLDYLKYHSFSQLLTGDPNTPSKNTALT